MGPVRKQSRGIGSNDPNLIVDQGAENDCPLLASWSSPTYLYQKVSQHVLYAAPRKHRPAALSRVSLDVYPCPTRIHWLSPVGVLLSEWDIAGTAFS